MEDNTQDIFEKILSQKKPFCQCIAYHLREHVKVESRKMCPHIKLNQQLMKPKIIGLIGYWKGKKCFRGFAVVFMV